MNGPRPVATVVARISPAPAPKASFPMLPWYPASFHSATRGWSITARGIYRELLDAQWELGGLPAEAAALRRLIQASPTEWRSWAQVEAKFPIGADGLRRNVTLERHRAHAQKRSDDARKSARARWNNATQGKPSDANA